MGCFPQQYSCVFAEHIPGACVLRRHPDDAEGDQQDDESNHQDRDEETFPVPWLRSGGDQFLGEEMAVSKTLWMYKVA